MAFFNYPGMEHVRPITSTMYLTTEMAVPRLRDLGPAAAAAIGNLGPTSLIIPLYGYATNNLVTSLFLQKSILKGQIDLRPLLVNVGQSQLKD